MNKEIHVKVSLEDKDWTEARSIILKVFPRPFSSSIRDRIGHIVRGCIYREVVVHRKTALRAEHHIRLSFFLDKFREDIAVAAKQLHV